MKRVVTAVLALGLGLWPFFLFDQLQEAAVYEACLEHFARGVCDRPAWSTDALLLPQVLVLCFNALGVRWLYMQINGDGR